MQRHNQHLFFDTPGPFTKLCADDPGLTVWGVIRGGCPRLLWLMGLEIATAIVAAYALVTVRETSVVIAGVFIITIMLVGIGLACREIRYIVESFKASGEVLADRDQCVKLSGVSNTIIWLYIEIGTQLGMHIPQLSSKSDAYKTMEGSTAFGNFIDGNTRPEHIAATRQVIQTLERFERVFINTVDNATTRSLKKLKEEFSRQVADFVDKVVAPEVVRRLEQRNKSNRELQAKRAEEQRLSEEKREQAEATIAEFLGTSVTTE